MNLTKKEEKRIADWLRVVANHIENGGSPYIFDFNLPKREPDKPCQEEMIETFSVTLSLPWGG